MPNATRTRILLLLFLLPWGAGRAQGVTFLHSIAFGSAGNATLKVPFSESGLSEVHSTLVKALGVRPKSQVTISLSSLSREPVFGRFATTYANAESTDLFVGICVAGWQGDPGRPELFRVAASHPDTVTAEYLLHFLGFMPTQNAVFFLLAPSKAEFPVEIIKATGTGGGGGKYLVFVRTQERTTFENLVEDFIDSFEEAEGERGADVNKDSYVSFSEWLQELSTICTASKISLFPYKIGDAQDLKIKRVQ